MNGGLGTAVPGGMTDCAGTGTAIIAREKDCNPQSGTVCNLDAETKRVASTGGSRRLQTSSSGQTRRPGKDGAADVVSATVGYATTMAISTLRKLLGASSLRRGDGVIALPESRRKQRLLAGRTSLAPKMVKMEILRNEYKPHLDTCI